MDESSNMQNYFKGSEHMQFDIILKENSPYTHYCPRPLITSDVRAYRVVIKTEQITEGAHLLVTAIRSDGQAVTDIGEMYGGYGEYTLASNMYSVTGDMRLLVTVVDFDGAALTAKEIIFTVAQGGSDESIDGDDRVPALNNMLARCNAVLDQCNSLKADYGEIINLYNNLLSPRYITNTGSNGVVSITGLEKGRDYCFNFMPYDVIGINDEGEAESVSYTTNGGNTYISAVDMNYSTLSIPFDPTLDSTYFMLFEGNALPPVFKPYGTAAYINDDMLGSVYAEIDKVKDTLIVAQADENGVVKLSPDKVHSLTIDGDIRFVLPSVDTYCTITVQANIIGENAIDWGTTYFFKNEIPYIEEGEYDLFFEYDGAWYVGAVAKGQVIV